MLVVSEPTQTNTMCHYHTLDIHNIGSPIEVIHRTRGVHSIVKLNTTCDKEKYTFNIKDHQNRSIFFFHFLFMSRYAQYLLHSKKI
jgi:hypothetical protein